MAVGDAQYHFPVVDVWESGRHNNGGVLSDSTFSIALANAEANLPQPATVIDSLGKSPFALVGDGAFPLRSYLFRPFPGRNLTIRKRIFNYRLSRARRIVENAFGILANKWRRFRKPIKASPESAKNFSRPASHYTTFWGAKSPHCTAQHWSALPTPRMLRVNVYLVDGLMALDEMLFSP